MKQGHFDIAGLLLRDFLFDSVNFAMDQSIVEVLTAAGNTVRTQKPYMQREFNREIKAAWQRLETLYKLVDEPDASNGTHRGLYENKQTIGRNRLGQQRWTKMLTWAHTTNNSLSLTLFIHGIVPDLL